MDTTTDAPDTTQIETGELSAGHAVQADVQRVFAQQKKYALKLRTSTADERIAQLEKLKAAVLSRAGAICEAGYKDFRKPASEAELTEVFPVVAEANHAIRHLKKWIKPQRVRPTLAMLGTRGEVRYEPKGVCLLIAPWNYPFNLAIGPLVAAIAAGNTAIIKPSEMTPHMSAVVVDLVRNTFAEEQVAVFEGDARMSQALLALPFDHVFFTGSPEVGKIVMAAAARHLTSVTLELGGKCPAIVDESANPKKAARNIMWAKFANAGQTCVAPDHLYLHGSLKDSFMRHAGRIIARTFGDTREQQAASQDFCRIVNERHFKRLAGLYHDAVERGGSTVAGGDLSPGDNYISPTLLENVPADAEIMKEEIFGPLLPVITFQDLDQVIDEINGRPKPLALYVYGRDRERIETVLRRTSAGDSCVNHNAAHFLHCNLPFGGVNNSGIGKAHGFHGFKAFSHERSVMTDKFSTLHLLYPPYKPRVKKLIEFAVRYLS